MFTSWGPALVFGIIITFISGVIATVIARMELKNLNKSDINA